MYPRNITHVHTRLVHEYLKQPKIGDLPKAWSKEPVTRGHTEISKIEISGCQVGWGWEGLLLGRECLWSEESLLNLDSGEGHTTL